jgi:hypothetical protein
MTGYDVKECFQCFDQQDHHLIISITFDGGEIPAYFILGEGPPVIDKEQEWYTNKELYEMMVELSKGLEKTNAELSKTQTMIRDYNGLRERLDVCEKRLDQTTGQSQGSKDMWGYIVGGIGLLFAILSQING